ncbi:MAG: hypothetical protein OXG64_07315 [Chloroflexi bacterium]|nr:hypothetical protein [Chloroflexota bacterium]
MPQVNPPTVWVVPVRVSFCVVQVGVLPSRDSTLDAAAGWRHARGDL